MTSDAFEIAADGFLPLRLGMDRAQADAAMGEQSTPDGAGLEGEEAFLYTGRAARIVFREGRAVELSLWPPAQVSFRGRPLFGSPDVWREIVAADGDAQTAYGFVVMRTLGLTLTGFHDDDPSQLAITAFEPGRWDDPAFDMRPFRL